MVVKRRNAISPEATVISEDPQSATFGIGFNMGGSDGVVADDGSFELGNPEEPSTGTAAVRVTRTVRPDQEQGREWDPEFQSRVRDVARSLTLREGQSIALDLKLASGL